MDDDAGVSFDNDVLLEDVDGIGEQLLLPANNSEVVATATKATPPQLANGDSWDAGPSSDIPDPIDAQTAAESIKETEQIVNAVLLASEAAAKAAEVSLLNEGANNVISTETNIPKRDDSGVVVTPEVIRVPSVKKIVSFAIPAIGVWLCSPLLSLIDTSAVGLLSGTSQQAALNPAVAVVDYAALLMAFMYTATTNLVAAAQEKDRQVEGKPRTAKMLIGSMQLSGYAGTFLGATLIIFSKVLLKAIIGNDALDPDVFLAAMKYVCIRALGMPAAVILGSAQAACLGMQDIRSPLYVLFAAAVVNLFGDMLFVGSTNPWIGGAAGAAWATVFSQYAALFMFLKWLRSKPNPKPVPTPMPAEPNVMNLTDAIMELTGPSSSKGSSRRKNFSQSLRSFGNWSSKKVNGAGKPLFSRRSKAVKKKVTKEEDEPYFSTRGFLSGRFKKRNLFTFPPKDVTNEFAPYVFPVTVTSVGRVSGYVAMSHVVSSALGTVGMAAQQVIVSVFYCLTPIADSLGLTAQSFVPGLVEKKKSPERSAALKQTLINLNKAGFLFGAAMVSAIACLPLVSKFFTTDPNVIAQVNSVVPMLSVFFTVHAMFCGTEGFLLGRKDLGFLSKMYAGFFVVVPWCLLRVKRAALAGANVNLATVWTVFTGYQLVRVSSWFIRARFLLKRSERKSNAIEGDMLNVDNQSP